MSYEKALEVIIKIDMKIKELIDSFGCHPTFRLAYITWCRNFVRHPYGGISLYDRLHGKMSDEEMIEHGVKWGLDQERLRFLAKRLREESCVIGG